MIFDVGDAVRLRTEIRDSAGQLAVPTTITLKLKDPRGSIETIAQGSLTNPSTGVYHYDKTIPAGTDGRWVYRFETTGPANAEERWFYVRDSGFD